MPQTTTVVLTDGIGENVSFSPRDARPGLAHLVNSTGVPIGDRTITVQLAKVANNRRRVKLNLTHPIVQTMVVNGVSTPTIVRTAYASAEFQFDATSSTAERDNVRKLFSSLLANASLVGPAIVDLDAPF